MKCHVKNCENHEHQGLFVGIVCSPCYEFLSKGKGKYSQLYRNTVAAEREACAKVADNGRFLHDDSPEAKFGKACAAAIRARGNNGT